MKVHAFKVGPADNNVYAIFDDLESACVLVDPGIDSQQLWSQLSGKSSHLRFILNTHAHIDHVYENDFFKKKTGGLICMHPDAAKSIDEISLQALWFGINPPVPFKPDKMLDEGDVIPIGDEKLKVVYTPGHSPGGICFVGDGFVIVGDILFAGTVGRTDLPGGDMNTLLDSIHVKLITLPDDFIVYPGHGPSTTIREERMFNPFLKETR